MATMRGPHPSISRPPTPRLPPIRCTPEREAMTGTLAEAICLRARQSLWAAALALLSVLPAAFGAAWAQTGYPNRPLHFVIAFGPGGVGDTTSRLVADKLGDKL